ncbi:hypothetical protein J14TS2_26130 [Bacillus sp. J14TS2]|uniref:hypothetical protein n=1 Tax=Bacillus sp. J14TS2 TaxID=2807188 RepID=UPI001B1B3BD3|nr:hypothetical protein [Bacillus sp. J14TS2]GIN72138.1 hypothetical protein J14TS2_26130 [Bacillus sp. J14TS2]
MKKTIIVIAIILGGAFLIFVLPVLVIGYMISHEVQKVKDEYGYSNEEIIEYVEEEHGFVVEVLSNEGRDPSSKGLVVQDARVRQVDEDQLEFDIQINTFGKIKGDNYKEIKQRFDLNLAYQNSELFHDLQQLGFTNLSFGEEADDPEFYIALPTKQYMADPETLQMLYDAIPLLKKLQAEVSKEGYEFNEVSVHGANLEIGTSYQSPEDLGNKFAADNISHFEYQFIENDREQVQEILPQLQNHGFNKDNNDSMLTCYEMVEYQQCHAYELTLHSYESAEDDHDSLQYDVENDRDNLFQAIEEINKVELPIKKIRVDSVYTPENPDDQVYTEEELRARDGVVQFANRTVEIINFDKLETAKDIEFIY